jgi:hypothetical protein
MRLDFYINGAPCDALKAKGVNSELAVGEKIAQLSPEDGTTTAHKFCLINVIFQMSFLILP